MTIETIISNAMPASPAKGARGAGERRGTMEQGMGQADRVNLSARARSLYDADQDRKLDVIRERVRRGYYLDGYVMEQVVDSVARDIEAALGR